MKFVVEQMSKSGGRLGQLSGLRNQAVIDTPLAVVPTLGGSAPHLTQDVLHMVVEKTALMCFPSQHFCEHTTTLQKFKKGVAKFSALPSHGACVSVQDALKKTPSGYNEKKGVSLWTYGGRHLVTPEKYMELIEAMQPDWYEALNDADTDVNSSKKRIAKSMINSSTLLDKCIDVRKNTSGLGSAVMFAPLLGGHSEDDRRRWAKSVAARVQEDAIGGFSLLGLHTNGPTTQDIDIHHLEKLVHSSLEPVPEELPRQAFGAWNPLAIISLAEQGIDIFDATFPTLVTERRAALVFPTNIISEEDSSQEEGLEHKPKKLKCSEEGEAVDKDGEGGDGGPDSDHCSPYEVSLKDKRYYDSMKPLVKHCKCYTCQNFTCSYIHHLLNVNELLGPVLLMIHNLHHWMDFFTNIRAAIKENNLKALKNRLCEFVSGTEKL